MVFEFEFEFEFEFGVLLGGGEVDDDYGDDDGGLR